MMLPRHIKGAFPVTIQFDNDCGCQTWTKYSVPVLTSKAATFPVWVTVAIYKNLHCILDQFAYKL